MILQDTNMVLPSDANIILLKKQAWVCKKYINKLMILPETIKVLQDTHMILPNKCKRPTAVHMFQLGRTELGPTEGGGVKGKMSVIEIVIQSLLNSNKY